MRIFPPLIHLLHPGLLHPHTLARAQTSPIAANVLTTDTATLKNVTVLTAHPSSLPRSSHRSDHSGQMSGL